MKFWTDADGWPGIRIATQQPSGETDWVPELGRVFIGIDAEWNDQPAMDM
jgi:hypothetical protein